MDHKLEFISLFSGAGGLDLGFEDAGWRCLYASDLDKDSVATLQQNKGKRFGKSVAMRHAVIERADVIELRGREILAKVGKRKGEVPLLVGGPPCQSWSSAGHQRGFDDPRGQLFKEYVRIAQETGVRWLVFENVRGLLTARGPDGQPGSAIEHIRQVLLDAGFQTEVELLNAADYGVPQRRVRLFMIGFKSGDRPPFPTPTYRRSADLLTQGRKWVTLGECLEGVSTLDEIEVIRPNDTLAVQLASIEPGFGVKSPGKAESTRPGGHWGYKQGAFVADLALPARTVTASAQQDWIKDPVLGLRRLCPRECAAIQTFPAQWTFAGKRADQYRQIGNAVPPKLAEAVANALAGHIANLGPRLRRVQKQELAPLREHLVSFIRYTRKEERRNGESRRLAPQKKRTRIPAE
jgi:DNA (cytosine-5)-methyltransferase 1